MDLNNLEIKVSEDQAEIWEWGAEALNDKLFCGIAEEIFVGHGRINVMAYIPGVGWGMLAGWKSFTLKYQVYVAPQYRHRGIGTKLLRAIGYEYPESYLSEFRMQETGSRGVTRRIKRKLD